MTTEREHIIDLASRLVEIPSVTGREKEALQALGVVDGYLADEVKRGKIVTKRFGNEGVVSQIWGDPNHLMDPKLLLSGHIDVVKEDNDSQYHPSISNGKLFGRGAADMKGPDAAMVIAYKRWLQNGGPNGAGLVLTSDEESGGFKGTKHLIENEGLKPSIVFIPDCGSGAEFDIIDSQKAPHHFRVVAEGTGGHASRAFEKDNPIDRLIRAYLEVQSKFNLARPDNNWATSFAMTIVQSPVIDIYNPDTNDNVKNHEEAKDFKIGKLHQTDQAKKILDSLLTAKFLSANKIPSTAEAWFCWRWPLEQISFKEGMAEIRKIFEANGCKLVSDEHGGGGGCLIDDKKAPFVQKWKIIVENILGREVTFSKMHGATDGRHFYNSGCRQVLVTSNNGANVHARDEWIDVDSLVKLAQAVYTYQQEITK